MPTLLLLEYGNEADDAFYGLPWKRYGESSLQMLRQLSLSSVEKLTEEICWNSGCQRMDRKEPHHHFPYGSVFQLFVRVFPPHLTLSWACVPIVVSLTVGNNIDSCHSAEGKSHSIFMRIYFSSFRLAWPATVILFPVLWQKVNLARFL